MKMRTNCSKTLLSIALTFFLALGLILPEAAEPAFADEGNRELPPLIAHGGGDVLGYSTTNSLEALGRAVTNGFTLIELDFVFTTDGELVLLHDWENGGVYYLGLQDFDIRLKHSEFMKTKVLDRFTTVDMKALIGFLDEHPEVRIVVDTKKDNVEVLRQIARADKKNLDRWIPQAYAYDEVDQIRALGYDQVFLSLYKMTYFNSIETKAAFEELGIDALVMDYTVADTGFIDKFSDVDFPIYLHTVNDLDYALDQMENKNVYGVYTDSLIPEELVKSNDFHLAYKTGEYQSKRVESLDFEDDLELTMKGASNKTVTVYIAGKKKIEGRSNVFMTLKTEDLPVGYSEIKVVISSLRQGNEFEQNLYVWWDGSQGRIVADKYAYSLEAIRSAKDFQDTIANEPKSDGTILSACLVVKKGSSIYYDAGLAKEYRSGSEGIFVTQVSDEGDLQLPLVDTATLLGADSVTMDEDKNLIVKVGQTTYTSQLGEELVTVAERGNGTWEKILQEGMIISRSKSMAPGEFYQTISGRQWIHDGEIGILLPEGMELSEKEAVKLLEQAQKLY